MDKTIGFIGYGNMAQAMIKGLIESKTFPKSRIIASKRNISLVGEVEEKYRISIINDNRELARKSDFLILATKPNTYEGLLGEIKGSIKENSVVVSIGAGISSEFLRDNLPRGTKFIKTMPNTPAMVGEAMSAISPNESLNEEDIDNILKIFNSFGRTEIIDESLMDAFTGLCGSSPAYIYMLIEAMADGGVLGGIPRQEAYTMAAQAVLGAAKMVLETGIHPGQLKDQVCSPGGTTIEAVASLEENGLRSTIIKAIGVCTDKSRKMSR